jgi:hypothetical protein
MYDPNATAVDQSFLFGLLALQADLISRDDFVQACEEWSEQKELSLPRLLVQRGWLKAEDRREVERLVERKLARHGGDVRSALAELADNPLQKVFVTLQRNGSQASLPIPIAESASTSYENNGSMPVRRSNWGEYDAASEEEGTAGNDPEAGAWPRRGRRVRPRPLVATAAVIVGAIVAALALGVVLLQFLPPLPGMGQGNFRVPLLRGDQERQTVQQETQNLVKGLAVALGDKDEVIAQLERDPTLTEEQRQEALRIAESIQDGRIGSVSGAEARPLNDGSWFVVRDPGGTEEAYRRALRMAELAVQFAPHDSNILNTLGVAQYRVGNFSEAMKTLETSDRMNSRRLGFSIPQDLAFLAMSAYRLGEKDKARSYLDQLRKSVATVAHQLRSQLNLSECEAFLREAESLLDGKVPPAAKPRPKAKPKHSDDEFDA